MKNTIALTAFALVATAGAAEARDQIRIVGSSTVFPFTSAVAERFAQAGQFGAPIVESTGTGGGMKFFCAGVGEAHPDFTNASRAMKASEFDDCQKNGVSQITEMKIGFDGIVLANSRQGPAMKISKAQLFAALAKEVEVDGQIVANPYAMWSDIDPSLPAQKIEVLGPPPTSGTRDAFVELVMDAGCATFPAIKALEGDRKKAVCNTLREDGAYIEAGENDNIIVQRLGSNPAAFGIFGYSFLEENADKLQGAPFDGVAPSYEAIADSSYPVSRPLFVYIKDQHVGVIPGMKEFIAEYTSERALGADGYLADIGLVALPEAELQATRNEANNLVPMAKP
jgi:phosphate transport system substrate-binding protein